MSVRKQQEVNCDGETYSCFCLWDTLFELTKIRYCSFCHIGSYGKHFFNFLEYVCVFETCNDVLQVGAHAIIDACQIMIWHRKEACHSAIVGGYMWFLKSSLSPKFCIFVSKVGWVCRMLWSIQSLFSLYNMPSILSVTKYILLIPGIKEYFKMCPVLSWWKF